MIKVKELTFFLFLIGTIFLVSCHQNTDADLLKQIRSNVIKLPPDVTLSVANNEVYLYGFVESDSTSLAIENNFKDMHGVTGVVNKLKVVPALRKVSEI